MLKYLHIGRSFLFFFIFYSQGSGGGGDAATQAMEAICKWNLLLSFSLSFSLVFLQNEVEFDSSAHAFAQFFFFSSPQLRFFRCLS